MDDRTEHTTKLLETAPYGAIFICDPVGYLDTCNLATRLERHDLLISIPDFFDGPCCGFRKPIVITEDALRLFTDLQLARKQEYSDFLDGLNLRTPSGAKELKWQSFDYDDRATWPTKEGHYHVMISGDSESCDGHTLYEYPDYPTWAEAHFGYETDDDNPCVWFGQGSHDEEPETFFAYFGPIVIPSYDGE